MADAERTRSEYRLALPVASSGEQVAARRVRPDDVDGLAVLMLDAYRGTIDDEGETMVEALDAASFLVERCESEHSWVLDGDEGPTAVSLVAIVEGVPYIDLVAVAASAKKRGLGRAMVERSLAGLIEDWSEAGAAITDGNTASEALFVGLGARRVGPWPPLP